ncbi:hypothetical protein [Stappia stellulata]|uniref:Abi-alpha family protein n=1 Tax=Stappia stellulata TaxID=71235 RepID=UPI00146D4F69|nr:hypothetical protein [Stappia stellulata]
MKIDVGLSAKAEVKAEIPASSAGRLVDALTDLIRPFTERRGLKADQIRLQREDVLVEVARRARKRLRLDGVEAKPLPNKVLIPLLEKASLEDIDDEEMIARWSNLLANQNEAPGESKVWAVEILSTISSWQAQFLDELSRQQPSREFFRISAFTRDAVAEDFYSSVKLCEGKDEARVREVLKNLNGYTLVFLGDDISNTEEFEFSGLEEGPNILHLESLGLLWVNSTSFLAKSALSSNDQRCFLFNAHLSPLGSAFVSMVQKEEI